MGSLMIHTSFGLVKYEVQGEGVECPYRLTPLINLKAPLNATISPEILMYNYHSTPLQIVEVYSSGGAFQLELPSGKQEGPQALWEIPPFTTKAIIRVRFSGRQPGNHTAYVRIKISASNDPSLMDRMLVVPIEIEIFSHTGVYSNMPFINFGLLGATTTNRTSIERRNISLFNSKPGDGVELKSWGVISETNPEIINCVKLERHKENKLSFEFDWSQLREAERFNGQIVIETFSSSKKGSLDLYHIPFTGRTIKGNISYDPSSVQFLVDSINFEEDENELDDQFSDFGTVERTFELMNNFTTPIMVINLTTSTAGSDLKFTKYFKLFGFNPTTIVKPKETVNLFRIMLLNNRSLFSSSPSSPSQNELPIKFIIKLHTNLSTYEIPISIYNGRLQRLVPLEVTHYDGINAFDEKAINFGILPVAQSHKALIAFVNPNPVPVKVTNFRMKSPTDGTYMSVTLRGCGPLRMEKLVLCDEIEPNEWIVFEVGVKSASVGSYTGKFTVWTEVNGKAMEEILTPVKFTTAMGRLELNKDLLHFTDCYPVSSKKIIYRYF